MRSWPAALVEHLQQPVTTTCRLLKIVLTNGEEHGLTNLDHDVVYQGVTYSAINGFDASVIASDASYSIDNSEAFALLSAEVPGITIEKVKRGLLDDAEWAMYLVNYKDLTMGHGILDAGDVGEVKLVNDVVYMPELISYAMRLRNAIGHVDSRTCRATFGTDARSQTGCGVDVAPLWINGEVTNLDSDEGSRVFASDDLTGVVEDLVPGRVEWLTGDNVSQRIYQVEDFAAGTVQLFEPLPFPIKIGDTFRIRPDCDKQFATCRDRWGNKINYKGEPQIPTNDGTAAQTPGATV